MLSGFGHTAVVENVSDLLAVRTGIFQRRVRDVMGPPLPVMGSDGDSYEVVRLLRVHDQRGVVVLGPHGQVAGIVTEHDIIGMHNLRANTGVPVETIMTSPVHVARPDDYLYQAITAMRQHGAGCLPVVGDDGELVGTLALRQALAATFVPYLELMDQLTRAIDHEDVLSVREAQIAAAKLLLRDGSPVRDVQALLTHANNELYYRITLTATEELQEEGWGTPPVPFEVIVMGSGGRGESFLFPDQDNGLILDQYPDEHHNSVDAYFVRLATRVTDMLNGAGVPYCRGAVMATNPLWRKRLDQWQRQLGYWLSRPSSATLRLADIFFDFQPVYGQGSLSRALRERLTQTVPRHHAFLQMMERIQEGHGVALGLFRRLSPDSEAGVQSGRLNLKYHGLLPLVEAVRLMALREGIPATATRERMERLYEKGVLNTDEHEYLSAAFEHLTVLVLRQQLADHEARLPVGAYVPPESLSTRERALLIDALQAISRLRARVHSEFTGTI